jgi:hypothetical protein
MRSAKNLVVMVLGLVVSLAVVCKAEPMGTAWTYQGRLMDINEPADGLYDFQFNAYESPNSIRPLASLQDLNDIDVIDGYFTIELDFGNKIYDVNSVWLEIAVRSGDLVDPNAYVILSPRQQITPTPFAIYASSATISPPLHLSDERSEPVIEGANSGLGPGVQGQTSSGAKGGVVGRHTETGNYGYVGSSIYGLYGEIQTDTKNQAAVYGKDNSSGNYGYFGDANYGVYGEAYGNENAGVYGKGTDGSYAGYFDGSLHVTSKITKSYTTGTRNNAIPIAYGFINANGVPTNGTHNFSMYYDSLNHRYELVVSSPLSYYTMVVTPVSDTPRVASVYGSDMPSRIYVYIWTLGGSTVPCQFNFILYKYE